MLSDEVENVLSIEHYWTTYESPGDTGGPVGPDHTLQTYKEGGETLAMVYQARGLSQVQACQLCGISTTTMQRLRKKPGQAYPHTRSKICKALQIEEERYNNLRGE